VVSCPLFVELCAGTAALSLRLGREGARPPVSRMGAKTGYADRILTLLGLVPGQGAGHYLWCEPDPGVRLLLEAYRDAGLAREAAAIIRSWADEEPRALWERLREEGPPRGVEAGEVARWARLITANRLIPGRWADDGRWVNAARDGGEHTIGGVSFGGADFCTSALDLAEKFEATVGDMPATITPDARRVDPREVARWIVRATWSYEQGNIRTGFVGPGDRRQDTTATATQRAGMGLPATITPDARGIEPGPDLPPGTVAYMDPPYVGTTGYGHDLPRSEVVSLARRWADAGATVAISEAEPIGDLVSDGWYVVEVTEQRKGQKRTFSKQQREFLTMNRKPVEAVGPVMDLFGE